jgi:hypothetical protein
MDPTKRNLLRGDWLRQIGQIARAYKDGMRDVEEKYAFDAFFESYESSYALTLAYPEEILIETARREGICIEGRDKNAIVKELFEKKGGYDHR